MERTRRDIIREICVNGIIAAVYAALTIALSPIAYGPIQFRFSEILVLLCFFNKRYTVGLTLGCLLANCCSPTASLDVLFGTAATLLACLCIIFCKHMIVAIWFPVIFNGFIVAWELTFFGEPFWFSTLTVAAGELVVMIVGYVAFMFIKKNKSFFKAINATQNIEYKF
jgi:uncharacterized membrane protein